jgi:hypothetical protein
VFQKEGRGKERGGREEGGTEGGGSFSASQQTSRLKPEVNIFG